MSISHSELKVSFYIDGFNLYKGVLGDHPELKWLDLIALARLLAPRKALGDVYYFTAEIAPLRPGDSAPARQKLYLRALEVSGVKVVKGKFRSDPRWMPIRDPGLNEFTIPELFDKSAKESAATVISSLDEDARVLVTKFEEKRSDVNLAAHLLRDVFRNAISHAVVISGDTDLTTAVKFGVEAGCHVSVIIPSRSNASAALQDAASYVAWLKLGTLARAQFPRSLISPKGKPIIRPSEWT